MYELPKDETENESYTFKDAWNDVETEEKIEQITSQFLRLVWHV